MTPSRDQTDPSPHNATPTVKPGEAGQRVRVLVVDDQRLVREGIASLLGIQTGIEVVGTAADGREAVEQTLALAPDVVLMDVRMPGIDGVEAVAVLAHRAPRCRVVMLTTFDDEEYVVQALRAGAAGYLLKDLPAAELAEAVRLTNAGVTQLDDTAAKHVAAALSAHPAPAPATGLTDRETEVLRLIAAGSTNREIAARLHLSEGTVKNHISRILGRLGLRDRTQAALYARDHGVL
jgi:DNA-binding NarL/FixJ family response regulator